MQKKIIKYSNDHSIYLNSLSLSYCTDSILANHKQKTLVSLQYYCHSGLFAYFFSGKGTPDTNLRKNVIKAHEKTLIHPYYILQAISQMPHQMTASPK